MSVADTVIAIVADQLKRDPATLNTKTDLAEAGYESLDMIETVFAIEEKWNLDIDFNANDDGLQSFRTVEDIVKFVEQALLARDAP